MFVHMAIHRQFPEKTDALAASMSGFGDSMVDQDGFQQSFVLRDPATGWLGRAVTAWLATSWAVTNAQSFL